MTGLQEIYNNLKSDSFFKSQIFQIMFLWSPSLGGSIITSHKLSNLFLISGVCKNTFSAGAARKRTLLSSPFILALCRASVIASSTISIPTSLFHFPTFKKLIPILPVPQ